MRSSREGSASVPDPRRPIAAIYPHLLFDSKGIYLSVSTLQHPARPRCGSASNTQYTRLRTRYLIQESFTMIVKPLVSAVVLAWTLAAPSVSFAQSGGPVTRAQVRTELVQVEKGGYPMGAGAPMSCL